MIRSEAAFATVTAKFLTNQNGTLVPLAGKVTFDPKPTSIPALEGYLLPSNEEAALDQNGAIEVQLLAGEWTYEVRFDIKSATSAGTVYRRDPFNLTVARGTTVDLADLAPVDPADAPIEYVALSNYATIDYVDLVASGAAEVDLDQYASKVFVNEAIAAIPETDLTVYATQVYVEEAIGSIPDLTEYATNAEVGAAIEAIPDPDLSAYALKTEIPDLSGYVTDTELSDAIAAIPEPAPGIRGSRWYVSGADGITDYFQITDVVEGGIFIYPASRDLFQYLNSEWVYVGVLGQ